MPYNKDAGINDWTIAMNETNGSNAQWPPVVSGIAPLDTTGYWGDWSSGYHYGCQGGGHMWLYSSASAGSKPYPGQPCQCGQVVWGEEPAETDIAAAMRRIAQLERDIAALRERIERWEADS